MSKPRHKSAWKDSYTGWKPLARNTHFDLSAPLTASEHERYVAAMKRLVRVYCSPIHDERLRRWANNGEAAPAGR